MSDKRRRWFQIHLSTAVVMMAVAALFIQLNTHVVLVRNEKSPANEKVIILGQGWPASIIEFNTRNENWQTGDYGQFVDRFQTPAPGTWTWHLWSGGNLAIDLAVALAILLSIGWILELQIRRREA